MLGWRTRSARWTENPKTMVQLHPQAPKNLILCKSCSIRLGPANMLCYFSGRRLPLQGRGRWFESTTEYHHGLGHLSIPYSAQLRLLGKLKFAMIPSNKLPMDHFNCGGGIGRRLKVRPIIEYSKCRVGI